MDQPQFANTRVGHVARERRRRGWGNWGHQYSHHFHRYTPTWYRSRNRNPVQDLISCCCCLICVFIIVLVVIFASGASMVTSKGSGALIDVWNSDVTKWKNTYSTGIKEGVEYCVIYDMDDENLSGNYTMPVVHTADPYPVGSDSIAKYTPTYMKTTTSFKFEDRSWPTSAGSKHRTFYITADGKEFSGAGGRDITVDTMVFTSWDVYTDDPSSTCENSGTHTYWDYSDTVCEQKWGLDSICVSINPTTLEYENVGGASATAGNYGCFKGVTGKRDNLAMHAVPYNSAKYWVGTYKTHKINNYDSPSGYVEVRDSHDPYLLFYKANDGNMNLGWSKAQNVVIGIAMMAGSGCVACCPLILICVMVFVVVKLCTSAKSAPATTTTTTTVVQQGQPTQPLVQGQVGYPAQPGMVQPGMVYPGQPGYVQPGVVYAQPGQPGYQQM